MNTIATASGQRITPPKAQIPRPTPPALAFPFSATLAKQLADRWEHGGNFTQLADALLDLVCEHIRRAPIAQMDKRIVDAIEDHMSVDPLEGDTDEATECSVEDLERTRAAAFARLSMKTSGDHNVRFNADESLRTMLKRPQETDRYDQLRADGYNPAGALSLILSERRVATMKDDSPRCQHCGTSAIEQGAALLRYSDGRWINGERYGELCRPCAVLGKEWEGAL